VRIDEYSSHDATGLAALIHSGAVSEAEVGAAALAAIAAVNPKIEAVLDVAAEAPKAAGDGPLFGVPFLIKDLGPALAGMKSEAGSRLCQGYVPDANSHLVNRYLGAGLVILGRTESPNSVSARRPSRCSMARRAIRGIRCSRQAVPAAVRQRQLRPARFRPPTPMTAADRSGFRRRSAALSA